jgi:spore germination protein GerM
MQRPSRFALLGIALTIVIAWVMVFALPRWYGPEKAPAPAASEPSETTAARRITVTLFYISEDGLRLASAQREVPFGATPAEQARHILDEALKAPADPLASAIPGDTRLRAVFVSPRGEAFVDLSGEVARNHGGGSLDELFTVYAIVNALTVNLPAITAVQILVDGKEVDTLAGHVDLRRPLGRNLKWTEQ